MSKRYIETKRIDENKVLIETPSGLPVTLFANEQVPIDRASLSEVYNISSIRDVVAELNAIDFFGTPASIERVVLTPDFHKGSGIPVGTVMSTDGFVIPKSTGSDIGCGMRLVVTDMSRDEFESLKGLEGALRHVNFQGGRNIPFSEEGRADMLRNGLAGLSQSLGQEGIWQSFDEAKIAEEIRHSHKGGQWATSDIWRFGDFVRGSGGVSRDNTIATIGGGNHFVEFGYIDEVIDRKTAYQWNLPLDKVTLMVHSGSLGLGGMVGEYFCELAKKLRPTSIKADSHGFDPLPLTGPLAHHGEAYVSAMGLAVNFAIVNRLMLSEIALSALSRVAGRKVTSKPLYDSPHNLAWIDGTKVIHRKGACPAGLDMNDELFPDGDPVLVPGSMGTASYILKGCGNDESLSSAPHGAGRLAKRGEGRRGNTEELKTLRIVNPLDPLRVRADIVKSIMIDMMEEAPSQYKPVRPAIDTVESAGIATTVVKLMPLVTIKA